MLIAKYLNPNSDIEEMIKHFEDEYKISLPIQYRTFLQKYNGVYTPETNLKVKRFFTDINDFYGVGDAKDRLEDIAWLEDFLEKNWIPIASTCFGDYIAICIRGEEEGKIYFLDHERGYRKKFLADDLKQLLDYCKSEEIGPCRTIEEREANMLAKGMGEYITEELKEAWQEDIDRFKDMVREEVIID